MASKSRRSVPEGKKGRPACAGFLNKFPDGKRIYYPTEAGKYGVYVFRKAQNINLALFTENEDGTINWHPRVVPNHKTGKPLFIYDLIEVHKIIADEVAQAIVDLCEENYGDKKTVFQHHAAVVQKTTEETEEEKLLKKFPL